MNEEKAPQLSKEQALKLFNKKLRHIKKILKKKVAAHYDALDFKAVYKEFLEYLQEDEFWVIREMPGSGEFDDYIDDICRKFLIEKTYFHFLFIDKDMVTKFVTDVTRKNKIPSECNPEIEIYVREQLEDKKKLEKVKNGFKEQSKLKTYFYAMIRFAVIDYERKYNVAIFELEENNDLDRLSADGASPFTEAEISEIKESISKLSDDEKIAFKMYYFRKTPNISAIAKTLKTTHFKAKKILQRAEEKVLKGSDNIRYTIKRTASATEKMYPAKRPNFCQAVCPNHADQVQ